MAKCLDILIEPDARLHQISRTVDLHDPQLETLIQDMKLTMKEAGGIGLAAPQVNVFKRLFLIDLGVSYEGCTASNVQVCINPEILEKSPEQKNGPEGCLSIPGYFDEVMRHVWVRVEFYDAQGQRHEKTLTNLAAVCFQHELDHLNGVVFIDYLSKERRNIALRTMTQNQ